MDDRKLDGSLSNWILFCCCVFSRCLLLFSCRFVLIGRGFKRIFVQLIVWGDFCVFRTLQGGDHRLLDVPCTQMFLKFLFHSHFYSSWKMTALKNPFFTCKRVLIRLCSLFDLFTASTALNKLDNINFQDYP